MDLKVEIRGFFCDIVTEILPFKVVNDYDATQQALALWDPSKAGRYLTGEPFPKVLAGIQAADIEYDLYDRIYRRGASIDFDLLKMKECQVTPKYMQIYKMYYKTLPYEIPGSLVDEGKAVKINIVHIFWSYQFYVRR